ncbi:MAG TPA: TolC family protein [Bryobacteraceae bacterium]|nr:TolC family protein [Bryobacteraceae bacterium]
MLSRAFLALILSGAAAFGQLASFPKPAYFRETFARPVMQVELKPPARLQDYVVGGKLELSLRSYLDLVMANNTDIAIQRLTVDLAQNAITRAFAPFDPLATASFTSTEQRTPSGNQLTGATTLVSLSQPANFTYSQTLPTGLQYQAGFSAQKLSTNSGYYYYNPNIVSNLSLNISQPLIRNRGTYINRVPIMVASSRLRKTNYDLKTSLLQLVGAAENAYWDAVLARENLRVAESARDLADQALKRAQRELELGALSPLDIYNPEQQYATSKIGVSQAQYFLKQTEDALRRQIGADLDPQIRLLPIELTETVTPEVDAPPIDAEKEVQKALAVRPDLMSAKQNLDIDDLGIRQAKNELLPDLELTGSYATQGLGGIFYPGSGEPGIPGGFGDALSQMFGFGYPMYSFGLTLRLPIKSHQASADMADSLLAKKRDALTVRTVEQQVRLDVLTAVSQVESSKDAMKLSVVAQDYSRKYMEAEQKKYELGNSTIFFVLQAQGALVTAESSVVQNSVSYRRNLMNLLWRTGELLEARGVVVP